MAIHEYVTAGDVLAFRPTMDPARLAAFVVAANAQAIIAAPGLSDPAVLSDDAVLESLRHILRGAILRWDDLANGSSSATTMQRSAGPMSESQTVDTRQPGGYSLWPTEEDRIRALLGGEAGGAFTITTLPPVSLQVHRDVCSIYFGSPFCSCGAILTDYLFPIYEDGAY